MFREGRRVERRESLLDYKLVARIGDIDIYEVKFLDGLEHGFRARTTFRKPVYGKGQREPVSHVDKTIEVVVGGKMVNGEFIGVNKAREKIERRKKHEEEYARPYRVMHHQKRAGHKARRKSRRAGARQQWSGGW